MANKLMDESIALQQRPLGNYADALGKSYKDLEDRLKKEQGGGFWSGLGVNFLNKAIIDPLATQATESISDLISSPFEQNYEEFYQQKEQIEAKRLVRKAAEKSTQLQTQETERRKQGLNVVDYLTDSVQTKQRAREEFIKTELEAGRHVPAGYTPAIIDQLTKKSRKAWAEKFAPLYENQVELSENLVDEESMKKLMPNVPFKSRAEWGSALLKMNVNNAAKRLFVDKADDAAEWFAISPSKLITKRYNQSGGTNVPPAERTKDMKGIGMEEFYGGPTSTDYKGKHYTSVLEKEMKRLAKENNSEFKIIKIDNVGDAFAVKLTPEMLLPHKTHR